MSGQKNDAGGAADQPLVGTKAVRRRYRWCIHQRAMTPWTAIDQRRYMGFAGRPHLISGISRFCQGPDSPVRRHMPDVRSGHYHYDRCDLWLSRRFFFSAPSHLFTPRPSQSWVKRNGPGPKSKYLTPVRLFDRVRPSTQPSSSFFHAMDPNTSMTSSLTSTLTLIVFSLFQCYIATV